MSRNKSSTQCADLIRKYMDRLSLNLLTMEWSDFYVFVGRETVRKSFTADLHEQLRCRQIVYSEGATCAIFARDYNSVPAEKDLINA